MASLMSHLSLYPAKPINVSSFSSKFSPSLALRTSQTNIVSLKSSPENIQVEFSGKQLRFSGWDHLLRRRGLVEIPLIKAVASADDADQDIEISDGFVFELFKILKSFFFFDFFDKGYTCNFTNRLTITEPPKSLAERFPALVTGFFFFTW